MRKMILTLITLTLLSAELTAPPNERLAIVRHEPINPYEKIWLATCKVESDFDTLAIGDNGMSFGICQIQQVRLTEYNRLTGERLKLTDCYDYQTSKRVFMYYSCKFRYDDYKAIAIDWNKSKTLKYWNRVKQQL